jgi:hypothetical protein
VSLLRFPLACLVAALGTLPGPGVAPARLQEGAPLLSGAEDLTHAGRAFVELATTRDTYLVGERFELGLTFGFELGFLRASLVQRFQRPLDVPAQVFAPALEALEGLRFLEPLERAGGVTFALGERVVRAARRAEREREGRTYAVFELARAAVATRGGMLELGVPSLCFTHAARFEDDFVHGRRPLDPREAVVRGAGLRLTILPPPDEGRPAEFTGAIGRFTIEAEARPQDLVCGEGLELCVRIASVDEFGDLSLCAEPRLEGFSAFHQRGLLVERAERELTARYDLVPLHEGALELPSVRFASYDTSPPAGYVTLETRPIPLVVRAPGGARPAAGTAPGGGSAVLALLLGAGFLVLLVALGIAVRRRGASR